MFLPIIVHVTQTPLTRSRKCAQQVVVASSFKRRNQNDQPSGTELADFNIVYGTETPSYEAADDGALGDGEGELDSGDLQRRFAFLQTRMSDAACQHATLVEKV